MTSESALQVHATIAGLRIGYYSRRPRQEYEPERDFRRAQREADLSAEALGEGGWPAWPRRSSSPAIDD